MDGDFLGIPGLTKQDADCIVVETLADMVGTAEEMAVDTGIFLDALFLHEQPPPKFPRRFLSQLAAILRIDRWQRAGTAEMLGLDLPPAEQLWFELVADLKGDGIDWDETAPLFHTICELARTRCVSRALNLLGVDVVLEQPCLASASQGVADILWDLRHLIVRSAT